MKIIPVPGLAEAYDAERNIRLASWLPIAAEVGGLALPHFTLRHYPFLAASPLIQGGAVTYADALQALWIVTAADPFNLSRREDFLQRFEDEEAFQDVVPQMISYFSDAFFDAPTSNGGEISAPTMTFVDWMILRFTVDPWKWEAQRILAAPIRQLFQLSKTYLAYTGSAVKNPLSDDISRNFIRKLNGL